MNREILFRGKRVDNGKWIEGFYAECDKRAFIMAEPDCDISKHMLDGYWLGVFYEVIPETVGRYAVLTDKNGKKIFEGDIVSDGNPDNYLGIVEWSDYNKGLVVSFGGLPENFHELISVDRVEFDIIGNIHDNPELLEV